MEEEGEEEGEEGGGGGTAGRVDFKLNRKRGAVKVYSTVL